VAETIISNFIKIFFVFMLWTFLIYFMHRLAHVKHKLNFLYFIHRHHHRVNYLSSKLRSFNWRHFLFYFGSIHESIDVLIMMTLPAILLCLLFPPYGLYILIFHYLYEVFLSESQLDHNPKITGAITNYFSWGKYHLYHHKNIQFNYSLIITFWDLIFKTRKIE